METAWKDCQCVCDAGRMGNRSAAQVLLEAGVLDAVSYYDSTGEMISAFEDGEVSAVLCGAVRCNVELWRCAMSLA